MPVSRALHAALWAGTTAALLLSPAAVLAREYSVPIKVSAVEELYDLADGDEITSDELELLIALMNRPMDLNRVDRYGLYDLPELTWFLVDAIIAYRADREGGFTLVEDLRDVEGMSEGIYQSIKPFVAVALTDDGAEAVPISGRARFGTVLEAGLGEDMRQTPRGDSYPSSYLDVQLDLFTYFGFGAQLIMRPLVDPQWDQSIGFLVDDGADCPGEFNSGCIKPRLSLPPKSIYATFEYNEWRVVVGTYNVGFGQRLTIDTTKKAYPRTWDETIGHTIDRDDGKVRPKANLRGIAASLDGLDTPFGWLDATVFFSHQTHDIYRNDVVYQGDEYFGAPVTCEADSDCPYGYKCEEYGVCATSTVFDQGNPGKKFQFHTYQDAFSEVMGGANVAFYFNERSHVGMTVYRSHLQFELPAESQPRFSPGAKYPRRQDFGAASIDGALGFEEINLELTAEIGLTHRGNPAGVGEVIYNPLDWLELTAGFRWYSRDYDNPHSRSDSAATETMGSRRRNEQGGILQVVARPISDLKLTTKLDIYDRRYREVFIGTSLTWIEDPIFFLRLRQRVSYELTYFEEIGFQFDYANNDLAENGRSNICEHREVSPGVPEETCGSYTSPGLDDSVFEDAFETDVATRFPGRGEKLRFQFSTTTTRLFDVRLSLKFVFALVDVKSRNGFALEEYIRFAASRKLWEGGRAWGAIKYWPEMAPGNSEDDLMGYAGLSQRLWDSLLYLQGVYGIKGSWRANAAGVYDLDIRHYMAIQLESRF